jgi:hypothetical protein
MKNHGCERSTAKMPTSTAVKPKRNPIIKGKSECTCEPDEIADLVRLISA